MTQLREREELRSEAGRDTISDVSRDVKRIPSADEIRTLVEGPPARRQIRWMRWLGAFAALVLAAGVTFLLTRGDDATTEPEISIGDRWFVSVDSPQFESLPVERPGNLPDNGYLMVIQTPHGVSFDFVLITQTPHGVSFDAFVPEALAGNPTQLPAGLSPDGTAWRAFTYELPEMTVAEGVAAAALANYQLPEMTVAEGQALAWNVNYQLPEMTVAEGQAQAWIDNYQLPEMTVAEAMAEAADG